MDWGVFAQVTIMSSSFPPKNRGKVKKSRFIRPEIKCIHAQKKQNRKKNQEKFQREKT